MINGIDKVFHYIVYIFNSGSKVQGVIMATRNILHRSKLDSFKEYLKANGWIIQDTKGMYEVLRAVNPEVRKRPLIIYDSKSKEHYSIDDRDFSIVRDFINSEG